MKRRGSQRPFPLAALLTAFCLGVLVDWSLRTYGPPMPVDAPAQIGSTAPNKEVGTSMAEARTPPADTNASDARVKIDATGANPAPAAASSTRGTSPSKSGAGLRLPIDGMELEPLRGGFLESRSGHRHEAIDILAPRDTPIHAVDNGTIARLFLSKQGGITVYQYDPSGKYCYYYAHLGHYATNIREGDPVTKGQVLGYVGTSGNAPPNTPHLHFAVFELSEDRSWWKGKAIDPYPVLKEKAGG